MAELRRDLVPQHVSSKRTILKCSQGLGKMNPSHLFYGRVEILCGNASREKQARSEAPCPETERYQKFYLEDIGSSLQSRYLVGSLAEPVLVQGLRDWILDVGTTERRSLSQNSSDGKWILE